MVVAWVQTKLITVHASNSEEVFCIYKLRWQLSLWCYTLAIFLNIPEYVFHYCWAYSREALNEGSILVMYVCTCQSCLGISICGIALGMSIWGHAQNVNLRSHPGRILDTCITQWYRDDVSWRQRKGRMARLALCNVCVLWSQVHKRMRNAANGWQLWETNWRSLPTVETKKVTEEWSRKSSKVERMYWRFLHKPSV